MGIPYNIASRDGENTSISVFIDGDDLVASRDHDSFDAIKRALVIDETDDVEYIKALFDVGTAIFTQFDQVTDQVWVGNGKIYYNGDPLSDEMTDTIINFFKENAGEEDSFLPIALFLEKLWSNPNANSRGAVIGWLNKHPGQYHVCPDGDLAVYKGVREQEDGSFLSGGQGHAIVDGVEYGVDGGVQIPTNPGSVVWMPRSEVQFDPHHGCSTGLHAGTHSYARSYGTVLQVKINPRDIVSVPVDDGGKIRTCRYRVLNVVDSPEEKVFLSDVATEAPEADAVTVNAVVDGAEVELDRLFPEFEAFTAKDFKELPYNELRKIAKAWALTVKTPVSKPKFVKKLSNEAKRRRAGVYPT